MIPWRVRAAPIALLIALAAQARPDLVIVTAPHAAAGPSPVGSEAVFDALATGDSVRYSWDFGDGGPGRAFAPEPRAVHRYARPGRFTVVARIQDASAQRTFTFFHLAHPPLAARRPAASGPLALDPARGRLWVVHPDHGTAACVDTRSLEKLFEVPVGAGPTSVALAPDGTVWVANKEDATVSVLAPTDGALLSTLRLPFASRPHGIAFAPDGGAGYISLEASGKILKVDPAARAVRGEIAVGPRPRAIAVPAQGPLLAAHFLPVDGKATITAVDPAGLSVAWRAVLGEDTTADAENRGRGFPNHLAALALDPAGVHAWIPSKKDNLRRGLARDGLPLSFENTVRAMAARLDPARRAEADSLRLDLDDSEGPAGIAFGPFGFPAFLSLQGSDKVLALDPWTGARAMTLDGVGAAPRGVLVDSAGGRLFVQAFLDRSVSAWDVRDLVAGRQTAASLLKVIRTAADEPLPAAVLRGKRLFHHAADPRMSKDGYLSCAACHADGDQDGRTWDFTDRGEGLRNTQTLAGRAGTGYGPLHWSANFDEVQDFEHDIRGAFGGQGFLPEAEFRKDGRDRPLGGRKAGLSPELDDLAAYVASLERTPASPYRAGDGSMTPEALAGKALFHGAETGCARCHAPPLYSDSRLPDPGSPPGNRHVGDTLTPEGFLLHDVGTASPVERRLGGAYLGFDTPGLKGIWNTAPYLHDGSVPDLEALVEGLGSRHGNVSGLSEAQRRQLAAYLLQLDDLDERGTGSISARRDAALPPWTLAVARSPGGWRIEVEGAQGLVTLRIHDLAGRHLGGTRQGTDSRGRSAWTWSGRPAAEPVILRACAGPGCLGRRLIP